MAQSPVQYRILPADPAAHLFEVSLTLADPRPGQRFLLPAWIPGSYMIREFARNIVWLRAECEGAAVPVAKTDKHTWQLGRLPAAGRPVTLTYAVYAWDLSVRCAHLDASHGFFNGTQVFLRAEGHEASAHRVEIVRPEGKGFAGWTVATTLPEAPGRGGARRNGFGAYLAPDYDTLVDHPVEMGDLTRVGFVVRGVPHELAIHGIHDADLDRLAADLSRICEAQCALFGDEPPPFSRYLFLLTVVGEGYGGLEHRDSTALLASRHDLPYRGMTGMPEAYRGFLGLCSHEYFHAWNVKRIRPAAFTPCDLQQENYTRLLWLFEGFTSYYDDLALLRSGVISRADYFALLARTLGAVRRGAGRTVQSVAESSFDAWIKYYRPDENSTNAVVSYYGKGALVALLLDLSLRDRSDGAQSLDVVMRALWARHGQGPGLAEDAVPALIREVTGIDLRKVLLDATEGTTELPLARALARVGVQLRWKAESATPTLGAKSVSEGDAVRLAAVYAGGPAVAAGLSAGDVLVAMDGLRVRAGGLEKMLARRQAGESVRIHAFRRDELIETSLVLGEPEPVVAELGEAPRAAARALRLREAWLRG